MHPHQHILFLDIETAPIAPSYEKLPEHFQPLWDKKEQQLQSFYDTEENLYQRAGIYAEFGKVVCISCGYLIPHDGHLQLRLKSFFGEDEVAILKGFAKLMELHFGSSQNSLCAHNGKEFDFPFLARRFLINKLSLPKLLQLAGLKPWQVKHFDTLELWKFGDYKHYTSLDLLCAVFGVESPKSNMTGADVAQVFWEEQNYKKIAHYCVQDVVALVQVFRCMQGQNQIKNEHIMLLDDLTSE